VCATAASAVTSFKKNPAKITPSTITTEATTPVTCSVVPTVADNPALVATTSDATIRVTNTDLSFGVSAGLTDQKIEHVQDEFSRCFSDSTALNVAVTDLMNKAVPVVVAMPALAANVVVANSVLNEAMASQQVCDEINALKLWLLAHYLPEIKHWRIDQTLNDIGRLLAMDSFDVVTMVATLRTNAKPVGFKNMMGVGCFVNSAVQLLISSEHAVSALASVEGGLTVQRAFLAAMAGLTDATRNGWAPLVNDYFFGFFFPSFLAQEHSCVNEALQTTLSDTLPVLAFFPVGTAGRGLMNLKTLLMEEMHGSLSVISEAQCLVVGVSPFETGSINYNSVIFDEVMTIAGGVWVLKGVIYWVGTDVNFGHYFAVVKRGDFWWTISDDNVQRASGPDVYRGRQSYVISTLIYDRV
jgi:hypothetical protein